eukprot:3629076-Heterocapsa_arctica.AAC.1
MAKCILALGYLYQTNSCDLLEGIMELVVWLEGRVKSPGNTKPAANSMEEEKPANMKLFQKAINMLKEMGE